MLTRTRWLGTHRIRIVTYRVPTSAGVATVNVAETTNRREAARHFILTSTWLMDFILVDATLLLVWVGVRYGLKPLARGARPDRVPLAAGAAAARNGCGSCGGTPAGGCAEWSI